MFNITLKKLWLRSKVYKVYDNIFYTYVGWKWAVVTHSRSPWQNFERDKQTKSYEDMNEIEQLLRIGVLLWFSYDKVFICRTSVTFQVPWMNFELADISTPIQHIVKGSTVCCHVHVIALCYFTKNINYYSHHPCGAYSPQHNKFLKLSTVF